jgi:hypothetical protein
MLPNSYNIADVTVTILGNTTQYVYLINELVIWGTFWMRTTTEQYEILLSLLIMKINFIL